MAQNEPHEPTAAEIAAETERGLLLQYTDGHEMYAKVNGRRFTVLYHSRHVGDPMPWIYKADPSLRFVNEVVTAECKGCGADLAPSRDPHHEFLAMDLCERCAVAELAGDLVQIEKGTMK